MKISNETKIGALTAISIVLLILGYNFLKGKDLFTHSSKLYAVFKNVEGVEASNAVTIKGLQVGTVYAINPADKDLNGIVITISLKKDVNIPKNSVAVINSGIIGSSNILISKGDAAEYLQDGDTLSTQEKPGVLSQLQQKLNPSVEKLNSTLGSVDSLVEVVGSMFDPKTKNNFAAIFAHLAASTASLENMLNQQSGALAKSLKNVDTFTTALARNNGQIDKTLSNLEKVTDKLANAKIDETLASLKATMDELKATISKVNSTNGTLGLLINDKKLYQNLESTTRSLNILLDDFRVHPKRYVNVSVFGKKDKSTPLSAPLSDSVSKPTNQ